MRLSILPAALAHSFLILLAAGQSTSALINKVLDEQVRLNMNKTLPEAMDFIQQQYGVRLEAHPSVWELLPWGRETNVTAKIENYTLREALSLITRKLGLSFVLREEFIEILPMPALKRLAQRSTVMELRALDVLASNLLGLDTDRPTIRRLLEAVDLKLAAQSKDGDFAIENRLGNAVDQNRQIFVPRNATLLEALESLPKETPATWYPWGKSILIVTKHDRTRALLERPVTVQTGQEGKDLLLVLTEISNSCGVPFDYQPGVIQELPVQLRVVRGIIENVPAQQVLSRLSATTGLAFLVEDDKVHVASSRTAGAQDTARRDPIVGIITLDSGIQVLVPASQIPDDMRQYLQLKTQKYLQKVRTMMEDEGFSPATQPGSQEPHR